MKLKDILLCLLSAVLFVLSLSNIDLEFFAWFAFVPLLFALDGKELLESFGCGFLTGFASFLGALYWIIVAVHTYGYIPVVPSGLILLLLVGYLSLFYGVFALIHHFLRQRLGSQAVFFAPFVWVSMEFLRSFFLTGFPWAMVGHTQYLNLPFVQMADLTGVYGLSFVILLVNATVYLILRRWSLKQFPYRAGAMTVIALLASLVYGYTRIHAIDRKVSQQPVLKVAVTQGNIDQSIKWDESFQKQTLKIYERLSLRVAQERPDLIIWPETATPFFFQDAKEYQPLVLNIPKETGASLLFGSPSYTVKDQRVSHYNSAYLISPGGEIVGKYDKIHLVPFGEYVPLKDLLFFMGSLGEGIGDFKSGKEATLLSLPQTRFGVVICFEIIFPDLCRQFVKKGAEFLVTLTNDAWFGRTSAPYQHMAIATFRAVENRVFIARAANTGISGFIDPKGKIISHGGIFTEEAMNETIRRMNEKTFYTLYGDVFAWVCAACTVFVLGTAALRKRGLKGKGQ